MAIHHCGTRGSISSTRSPRRTPLERRRLPPGSSAPPVRWKLNLCSAPVEALTHQSAGASGRSRAQRSITSVAKLKWSGASSASGFALCIALIVREIGNQSKAANIFGPAWVHRWVSTLLPSQSHPSPGQIRNPRAEIRRKSETRSPKRGSSDGLAACRVRISEVFGFRPSDFTFAASRKLSSKTAPNATPMRPQSHPQACYLRPTCALIRYLRLKIPY